LRGRRRWDGLVMHPRRRGRQGVAFRERSRHGALLPGSRMLTS